MADDASETDHGFVVLAEGTFAVSTVLPPEDYPVGKIPLLGAVHGFAAERAGRPVAEFTLGEVEQLAAPIKAGLLDGRLRATCVTRNGFHLEVDPAAFRDRQTWLAAFDPGVELPMRPRLGIEPGYLLVDSVGFKRFVTGFRAERALDLSGASYVPRLLRFGIDAVHRLGIVRGHYDGPDLVQALQDLAKRDGFDLSPRPAQNLARFMTNRAHFRDGWTSDTPPIFEFMLELIASCGLTEERRFNRVRFAHEIFNLGKERPDLGIGKTHTTFLSTFCGNPAHSKGGSSPRKVGSSEPRLSRARQSAKR